MKYAVGSLVKTRSREWVVLAQEADDFVILRPLGGTDDEVTGIHIGLETVEPAQFDLPDPNLIGDYRSCRLLRDAIRLSARSSTGPLRSLAKIAVEPRPYQLVPLLIALKLQPIRLAIADDVGIGKTIEACLIAAEMLARGEIKRIAVLCPPQLAEQWQKELSDKFHIHAELVLASTAGRLERNLQLNESLFDVYPHVIVSTDFIKADRRRQEFIQSCPEFVIVDEAHTCAFAEGNRGRHQRYELVSKLSQSPTRHLVLVTATPHSGKTDAFRSLITFLSSDLRNLPEDLRGPENEHHRRKLAQHFVQRRRADIKHYLKTDTPFPERKEAEETYSLSPGYKQLFEKALKYARTSVTTSKGNKFTQRVKWWSALALLRALSSSPAAASATLRERAGVTETTSIEEADEIGQRTVLDTVMDEFIDGVDVVPGADSEADDEEGEKNRKELLAMARDAEKLKGESDLKLKKAIKLIKEMISDGYHPIIFCRFIETADYLAEELKSSIKNVEVTSITGLLPPDERKSRVEALAKSEKRILVCTDCLSEGINLQQYFDAVMHYDLAWSPTRHEQREGRVDRFNQKAAVVRILTYYGVDNQIDGIVLDILLRKHKAIRNDLGISVPVPVDTNAVIEAIFEGLLLREKAGGKTEDFLPGLEDYLKPKKEDLYIQWENAANREKRSRTMFAQETIKVEEVAQTLEEAKSAIGSYEHTAGFVLNTLKLQKAVITEGKGSFGVDLREVPRGLRDLLNVDGQVLITFDLPAPDGALYLTRTHPFVEGLATHVIDTALDKITHGVAKRAGVIRTKAVDKRTTLLLVRYRHELITRIEKEEKSQLVEESLVLGFTGAPDNPTWLAQDKVEELLGSKPDENIHPEQASDFVTRVIQSISILVPQIESDAKKRGELLLEAHQRLRAAAKIKGITAKVETKLPADILGIYVYLPAQSRT